MASPLPPPPGPPASTLDQLLLERALQSALDVAPGGIVITSADRRVIEVNRAAERILDLTRQQIGGARPVAPEVAGLRRRHGTRSWRASAHDFGASESGLDTAFR